MSNQTPRMDAQALQAHQVQCETLIQSQLTILLGTVNDSGEPLCSYAPFTRDTAGVFYIFISELAEHTGNLMHHPEVSVLLIQPEAEAKNPFARQRAVFHCRADRVAPDSDTFTQIMADLTQRFGDTVTLLQSLPDFHLFALKPQSGTFVAGFGQAFQIDLGDGTLTHISRPRRR